MPHALLMVEFSFEAAHVAAQRCRDVAHALDQVLDRRARGAAALGRVWQGALHDDQFAVVSDALRREGSDLRDHLLQTAARIEASADAARAENARRRELNRQRELERQRELNRQRELDRQLDGPR